MRYWIAAFLAVTIAMLVALLALLSLAKYCSLEQPIAKFEQGSKPNGSDNHAKGPETGEAAANTNEADRKRPLGTFDLQITAPNKIEGNYYAQNGEGEKSNWVNKFVCDLKAGELSLLSSLLPSLFLPDCFGLRPTCSVRLPANFAPSRYRQPACLYVLFWLPMLIL